MHINLDRLTIDRSRPDVILVVDESEGITACSFSADAGWADHQIMTALRIAWQSFQEGTEYGITEGKRQVRAALGIHD